MWLIDAIGVDGGHTFRSDYLFRVRTARYDQNEGISVWEVAIVR